MNGGVLLTGIQVLDVVTDEGTPFRVVRIPGGVQHPVTPARANGETMVEFYHRDYPQQEPRMGGQFINGFYQTTLLDDRNTDVPLVLDSWVPMWKVDVDTMALVCAWLRSLDKSASTRRWYVVDSVTGNKRSRGFENYQSAVAICAASNVRGAGGRYVIQDQDGNRERDES